MGILFDKLIRKEGISDNLQADIDKITYDIKLVCDEIDKTEMWFEGENDEDLIDACLYQRELLNARYRYLLKRIKKLYIKQKSGSGEK